MAPGDTIKKSSLLRFLLVSITLIIQIGCRVDHGETTLRVAVAANMREPLEEIAKQYARSGGRPPELISGSSGKLVTQIREGAPFDLLVSADTIYANTLYRENLVSEPPEIYAHGQLILWSLKRDTLADIRQLEDSNFGSIAIANARMAPYGRASMEVLEYLDAGKLMNRQLVTGESISQVNQFIASGSVAAGFTALSTVRSKRLKEKGSFLLIPQGWYTPIAQSACVLTNSGETGREARKFYKYLFSGEAREILEEYGYVVPDLTPVP